jgi:hypothetical protein
MEEKHADVTDSLSCCKDEEFQTTHTTKINLLTLHIPWNIIFLVTHIVLANYGTQNLNIYLMMEYFP